ncbi:MAG TPA: hypothetical protein PLZ95_10615 [Bryobacteraceae bacterium]|nr:hypothetical protein [Bryobacteraceae bacterium]
MGESEPGLPAGRTGSVNAAFKSIWASALRPLPVPAPTVDSGLARLGFMPRSAEVVRFQMLRLEHAISPSGAIRCWLKLNLLLGLGLAIPAVLLVPTATAILAAFANWSAYVAAVALNLLLALVYAILIAAILSAVVGMARSRGA